MRKEMKRLRREAPWLFSGGGKNRRLKGTGSEAKDQAADRAETSVRTATAGQAGGTG